MITVEKLAEDAGAALSKHFSQTINGVKIEPKIYDHTDEIFFDSEDGVAVWCDVDCKPLPWFDGKPSLIISCSEELGICSIDLFIGDCCADVEGAEEAAEEFNGECGWHVENIDDFLMLQAVFPLDADGTLEENISSRLETLFDEEFAEYIKPIVDFFE